MPHKRPRKPKAPPPTRVDRLKDLARVFGVTDDTITAWKRNGAPAGPPFSIVEWYVWAKGRGYSPRLPEAPELAALCRRAQREPPRVDADSTAARQAEVPKHLIAAGIELGIHPPAEEFIDDEADRVLAWQRWGAAVKAALDIGERRRQLIPDSEVRERWRKMATRVLEMLGDVHTVISKVEGLTQPQRAQLRDALIDWIRSTRSRLQRQPSAADAGARTENQAAPEQSPGDDVA